MNKKICILGSTGSIGTQTLQVVDNNRDVLSVEAMTAGDNIALFTEQILRYRPHRHIILLHFSKQFRVFDSGQHIQQNIPPVLMVFHHLREMNILFFLEHIHIFKKPAFKCPASQIAEVVGHGA